MCTYIYIYIHIYYTCVYIYIRRRAARPECLLPTGLPEMRGALAGKVT